MKTPFLASLIALAALAAPAQGFRTLDFSDVIVPEPGALSILAILALGARSPPSSIRHQ